LAGIDRNWQGLFAVNISLTVKVYEYNDYCLELVLRKCNQLESDHFYDITIIDYQELRNFRTPSAHQPVLKSLRGNNCNFSQTAKILGITRITIYRALTRLDDANLENPSSAPKLAHKKTLKKAEEERPLIRKGALEALHQDVYSQ